MKKVETGFEPMFSDYEPDKLPTTKFYQKLKKSILITCKIFKTGNKIKI